MFISLKLFMFLKIGFSLQKFVRKVTYVYYNSHIYFILAASYRHFNSNLSDKGLDYISLKF